MKWLRFAGLAMLLVVVLAASLLWVARFRPGAGTMSHTVEIDRPPEVVWPWLRDPDKLTAWVSWLVAVEHDPASPPGVGHRETWTMEDKYNGNQPMRMTSTATEWDPPHRLVTRIVSADAFTGEGRYVLTPLPGGRTRLTGESRFRFGSWFARLLEPLITQQAQQKFQGDIARLKARIEAQPAPALTAAAR